MDKLQKVLETIKGIELTEEEQKSFDWLLTWESSTVENICSIIEKAKNKSIDNPHQEELLDWAKAAVTELDKLNDDRSARILRDGGKALIKEIEETLDN
ncbi:MAG: hypothetical protein ACOCRO_06380 [Halanaerobiales bacterium]